MDLQQHTKDCTKFQLNLCVSYSSRTEIANAARALAMAAVRGEMSPDMIDEAAVEQVMATHGIPDPDVLIRTSEMRLSNFLLWQLAYTELAFLPKLWPEVTEDDLVGVIDNYR